MLRNAPGRLLFSAYSILARDLHFTTKYHRKTTLYCGSDSVATVSEMLRTLGLLLWIQACGRGKEDWIEYTSIEDGFPVERWPSVCCRSMPSYVRHL